MRIPTPFSAGCAGSGERFASGGGSFWSWREAMYALVSTLDRASLARVCRHAFAEMRDAGITAVGEFHYLHHERDDDFAFDEVVLEAAADVGIRLVLLQAYYAAGGIGKPLEPGQPRFATLDLRAYWQPDRPPGRTAEVATQSLGVAAHSVRAASLAEIRALHAEAGRRGLPFHMHLEEQRREIEETVAAYGRTPMRLLCDELGEQGNLTAVHCTHTLTGRHGRVPLPRRARVRLPADRGEPRRRHPRSLGAPRGGRSHLPRNGLQRPNLGHRGDALAGVRAAPAG